MKRGITFIEGDVYRTKDNKLIMIHDKNLKRLTGVDVNLDQIDYKDLPNFQSNIDIHFSASDQYKNPENTHKKPDLLESFFKRFQNEPVFFSIDVKSNTIEDFELCRELVKKYGLEERVAIGMVNVSNDMLIKKYGEFVNFMDLRTGLKILLCFFLGKLFCFLGSKELSLFQCLIYIYTW